MTWDEQEVDEKTKTKKTKEEATHPDVQISNQTVRLKRLELLNSSSSYYVDVVVVVLRRRERRDFVDENDVTSPLLPSSAEYDVTSSTSSSYGSVLDNVAGVFLEPTWRSIVVVEIGSASSS